MAILDFLYENDLLSPATQFTPLVTGYEDTLYTQSGGMVTVYRLMGAIQRFSGEQREERMARLETRLETWNKEPGVYVSFLHEHDHTKVRPHLEEHHAPMRETMNRFGMSDGNHLLDSREDLLAGSLKHDALYLVIHTTHAVVDAKRRKAAKDNTFGVIGAQSAAVYHEVEDLHESTCRLFGDMLKEMTVLFSVMPARQVVGELASMWSRHEQSPNKFMLVGDRVNGLLDTYGYAKNKDGRYRAVLNREQATLPRIGEQVFTDKIYYPLDRDDSFRVRDTHQAAFRLTRSPGGSGFSTYNTLRENITRDVPYRIHFQMASGTSGSAALGLKQILSYAVSAFRPKNIDVARSIDSLKALEEAGYTHMSLKVVVATWAKNREALERNADRLDKAFSNWGGAGLTRIIASPDRVVSETLPGAIIRGPAAFMPIQMLSEIMPVEVAASPWESGLLMRSGENQPYPIDPGDESLINFHVYVLIGGTGRGKSVTMTDILKACLFRRGQDDLPEVRYLDVGYTSKAMFSYLRYLLPDNKRHQIVHEVMQNTAAYATNPWDTPLGMQEQSPQEKSFLVDFVSDVLTSGDSSGATMDGALQNLLDSLASMVVSEAYRMMSRNGEHRRLYYDISDVRPDFAEALHRHAIEARSGETSWWALVDALYAVHEIDLAEVAQRYAVPNFADMPNILASSSSIQESYKNMAPGGTHVLEYASTVLSTLITNYPVLAHETRVNFQQARIVGVDMQDVANTQEETNLFYSLLQNVLSRGFMMDPDEIARLDMPDQYREFHRDRIRALRARDKIFLFDELHRLSVGLDQTAPPPPAMMRLMRWIKEVRKYGIKLMLSTQSIAHMPDEIKEDEMWSLFFNMGIGRKQQQRVGELFDVSEYGMEVMRHELNGPEAGKGAPCLFMANTSKGKLEQKIYVSTSPMELWAAPTNQGNLVLMQEVLREIGDPVLTARALTVLFPGGSAGKEIDRLKKEQEMTDKEAQRVLIARAIDRSKELQRSDEKKMEHAS